MSLCACCCITRWTDGCNVNTIVPRRTVGVGPFETITPMRPEGLSCGQKLPYGMSIDSDRANPVSQHLGLSRDVPVLTGWPGTAASGWPHFDRFGRCPGTQARGTCFRNGPNYLLPREKCREVRGKPSRLVPIPQTCTRNPIPWRLSRSWRFSIGEPSCCCLRH